MSGDDLREAERLGPAPPVPEPGRIRSFLSLATVDVGPLRRHRDYRLLFVGQGVSFFGSMITYVALPYQAYQLSGSSLVVGLLSLAELAPLLVTAFVGGALADAFDRRRLVQIAELGLALCAGVLVLNSQLDEPKLWVLFVVGAAMAGLDGIQRPPLDALTPRLVKNSGSTSIPPSVSSGRASATSSARVELVVPGRVERVGDVEPAPVEGELDHLRSTAELAAGVGRLAEQPSSQSRPVSWGGPGRRCRTGAGRRAASWRGRGSGRPSRRPGR